ncbi:MAG TPA: DNA methyltransferase [Armatimonadota bacterium]
MHSPSSKTTVSNRYSIPRVSKRGNGEINKLDSADRSAHDWYRFVLSFPPHLVLDYLQRFGLSSDQRVLDPFCGTGTTLVECKKHGIPSVGIEAHPFSQFASTVKTNWSPEPEQLHEQASKIAEVATARLHDQGVDDSYTDFLFDKKSLGREYRSIEPEVEKLLLTNSISPLPLHKVLMLKEAIQEFGRPEFMGHLLLAFAKALVFSYSNLQFGPEVGVGPLKSDVPVVGTWREGVRVMADDLQLLHGLQGTSSKACLADARQASRLFEPASIDAVITSPPYPNEKDYTRTTRLETVLLGFIRNKAELPALKRTFVRSNTRSVYKGDDDDLWVAENHAVQRISEAIEARRIELGKTSGFERMYARVTKLYFGGMARHLAELRLLLRPGAQLAYVVGDQASYLRVMIRTGQLLAEIAESLGYQVTGIDLFRTRLATATREQLREEVVVLKWPG